MGYNVSILKVQRNSLRPSNPIDILKSVKKIRKNGEAWFMMFVLQADIRHGFMQGCAKACGHRGLTMTKHSFGLKTIGIKKGHYTLTPQYCNRPNLKY